MTPSSPSDAALPFQDADAYDQFMGRWSRRLAPLLIGFGGLADGERVLDVGCGTGSLTFALPVFASLTGVTGIDATEPFVTAARARNTDPRIAFDLGDARALPYADASFDRAYSSLVLQFIPDAAKAVAEMRRVVRPGGTVVAAVWDYYGGQPFTRILWDIAGVLDPMLERPFFRPLTGPGEIAAAWQAARAVQRCGMRRRLRRRSRPPMAARKRSWASELRRLDLRMLKAKLRSLAKMPGLMRMRERSSPMVTSRL